MKKLDMAPYRKANEGVSEKERSVLKLGGIATMISAVLYFIITIMIAVDPVGMYISGGEGFETLLKNPYVNVTWRLLFAFNNVLNIAIIPAFVFYVGRNNDKFHGILSFAKWIMLAGVTFAAVNWVHFVEVTSVMLNEYRAGYTMEAITGTHYFPIDSFFLWTWGMYGLGFLITNVIGFKTGKFSPKMGILGIICGCQLVSLVLFYISGLSVSLGGTPYSLMMLSAGLLGGITGPIFMFNCKKYYFA